MSNIDPSAADGRHSGHWCTKVLGRGGGGGLTPGTVQTFLLFEYLPCGIACLAYLKRHTTYCVLLCVVKACRWDEDGQVSVENDIGQGVDEGLIVDDQKHLQKNTESTHQNIV